MKAISCCLAFFALIIMAPDAEGEERSVRGVITDQSGRAIVGATAALVWNNQTLSGTACDTAGLFTLSWSTVSETGRAIDSDSLALECSAIGFETVLIPLNEMSIDETVHIRLFTSIVELSGVTASAARITPDRTESDDSEVRAAAQRSFVSSNPLAAVRSAAVSRSGSAFGSQVRFSGSNPNHTLNGVSLGSDPAHYGMFALLPSASVARVSFTDQSLSASAGSASAVALETDRRFGPTAGGNVSLSALESVGAYRLSGERGFLSGSLRKSVLDKLIRYAPGVRERATIPPTNYQDIYLSAGYRLRPGTDLFIDQFLAQDFLAFNTQATSVNSAGVETFQHTRRHNSALSLRHSAGRSLFKAHLNYESFKSEYRAGALDTQNPAALQLDLRENGYILQAGADLSVERESSRYQIGAAYKNRSNPGISLSQSNWNFLPPQSTSDNPHFYQLSLNTLYDELTVSDRGQELVFYADFERHWGSWHLQSGLRAQFNDHLAESARGLIRIALTQRWNERESLQLAFGGFAESPVKNLIDPYQILIRDNLAQLKYEKTQLAKLTYTRSGQMGRRFSAAIFAKRMYDLSSLTPEFFTPETEIERVFALADLSMQSNTSQTHTGFNLAYSDPAAFGESLDERLSLRVSYAYTHSAEETNGISTVLSEDAPHRFELDLAVDAGKMYDFGIQLFARSGYRYTEPVSPQAPMMALPTVYTELEYSAALASLNRERFPLNLNVNLSASKTFGDLALYMNVGNFFNRANPMVRTLDGYVYDAGILPSIGASYNF